MNRVLLSSLAALFVVGCDSLPKALEGDLSGGREVLDEPEEPEEPAEPNGICATPDWALLDDLLREVGFDYDGDVYDTLAQDLGEVAITAAATGARVELCGFAYQLFSEDGSYDNTLVFAWSGLDTAAGTADNLFAFRAPRLADPGARTVDPLSPFGLPGWYVFGDGVADTTFFAEDATVSVTGVTLDTSTEEDCGVWEKSAICTFGQVEGALDLSSRGYPGIDMDFRPPGSGGAPTLTDFDVTFDLPVFRQAIER